MPSRIQLRRTKGWRKPPNTVSVARPGKYGNPFHLLNEEGFPLIVDTRSGAGIFKQQSGGLSGDGRATVDWDWDEAQQAVVTLFRERAVDALPSLAPLRGKNLGCWCQLCIEHSDGKPFGVECDACAPCHADQLGELANRVAA